MVNLAKRQLALVFGWGLIFSLNLLSLPAQSIEGDWQTQLLIGGNNTLPLVFHFSPKPDGGWAGTLDSPRQGASGIPIDTVDWQPPQLRIIMPKLQLRLVGQLRGDSIAADFFQGPLGAKLVLRRVGSTEATSSPKRPQDPIPPFPYREEEVTFFNTAAKIKLSGTLTLPPGAGPFPAAVLISGSGPQDRNEEILDHRPFWVLADHLSRAGWAVLRYDDRGVGASEGDFASATSADFASDAASAWAFLRQHPAIVPQRIGLIGHSEGGLIAPMVAAQEPAVSFVVLLAGPGVPGTTLLQLQQKLIYTANGLDPKILAISQALTTKAAALAQKGNLSSAQKTKKLTAWVKAQGQKSAFALKDTDQKLLLDAVRPFSSPWFGYFLNYDPAPALKKLTCPVLAINGSKDLQVDADQNLPAIAAALKQGGNQHFLTKKLEGLNHLFQQSVTGNPSEYGVLAETFSPQALALIRQWLAETVLR